MARLPSLPFESDIDYLVGESFPHLKGFIKLAAAPGSDTLNNNIKSKVAAATKFRKELEEKSKPELRALVLEARKRDDEKKRLLLEQAEAARFFHQPNAAANFNLFASYPYWWVEEAVALSFGKDPRIVNWGNVERLVKISKFAEKFAEKREIAVRAQTFGYLSKKNTPLDFINWAEKSQFEMPADLVSKVRSIFNQPDWKLRAVTLELELSEEKERHATELAKLTNEVEKRYTDEPSPRERKSLHKMIIGMAIQKYGYDPLVNKTAATQRIVDDLTREGISIDVGTVLTHLRAAKSALPED